MLDGAHAANGDGAARNSSQPGPDSRKLLAEAFPTNRRTQAGRDSTADITGASRQASGKKNKSKKSDLAIVTEIEL